MNKEAKFSVLKGYIDCETSVLNSKVDLSIELLKKTITEIEECGSNNLETIQKKIRFLQKELSPNNNIKSLMKTQAVPLEAMRS